MCWRLVAAGTPIFERDDKGEMNRRSFLAAAPIGLSAALGTRGAISPPTLYGALPTERQMLWSELEFYNFLHFTVNTFTDREWGNGDEDPSIFNPTAFDADAIVETLKDA